MRRKKQLKSPGTVKVGLDRDIYSLEAIHSARKIYADFIRAEVVSLPGVYSLEISFLDAGQKDFLKKEFLNHILGLSLKCP